MLWALPLLASALVMLLRYGFGSIFVVGESVASALLRSTGADIAGTLGRLQLAPEAAAVAAFTGLVPCIAAASVSFRYPAAAALLCAVSAGWGWWTGLPWAMAPLLLACMAGLIASRA